jgi:hypothetical protein
MTGNKMNGDGKKDRKFSPIKPMKITAGFMVVPAAPILLPVILLPFFQAQSLV